MKQSRKVKDHLALSLSISVSTGKWHLGVNCEHRGDHCHHPNQHGFSYFFGLPFTLFNDCVPEGPSDVLVDLQHTLRNMSVMLAVGLATLVRVTLRQLRLYLLLFWFASGSKKETDT